MITCHWVSRLLKLKAEIKRKRDYKRDLCYNITAKKKPII
jgi:hypothetical protein